MEVKNHLREVLYEIGLTQAQLAVKIGVSRQQVSNIMTAKSSVTQELIDFLYHQYNVNINYLLFGKGDMFNKQSDSLSSSLNKKLEQFSSFNSKLYFLIDYFNRKPDISDEKLDELLNKKRLPSFNELNKIRNAYNISMDALVNDEEPSVITTLSSRELEVLEFMGQGMENSEISKSLDISVHTVKAHVSSILNKLHAKNRINAVYKYIQHLKNDNVKTGKN